MIAKRGKDVPDNTGRLAHLQRTTEATQQEFVYLGLQPIAMIETDQACMSTNAAARNSTSCATPKITYLCGDHLGTPRRASDATKNQIVWSWDSAPFGETPAQVDPKNTGTKTNITLRFPGQQYDSDTNLHYNQQRDYNPATGRYVQADPIGLAGGDNSYSYVKASPIEYSDRLGLAWQWCQRQGTMWYVNDATGARTFAGRGQAGNGANTNNPSAQCEKNSGPLPRGTYDIGAPRNDAYGLNAMRLTPRTSNQMCNRDRFWIHALEGASDGCIDLNSGIDIAAIARSSDRVLQVVESCLP